MNEGRVSGRPQRRSVAEAERLATEFEASGLTRREFCGSRGLTVSTLDAYRRRRRQAQRTAEAAKFLPDGQMELYLNGPGGRRLAMARYNDNSCSATQVSYKNWIYFGGRLIREQGPEGAQAILTDRLGSVRVTASLTTSTTSDYFPFGEERQATANDRDKFATYRRDSTTGLDYASNRYYATQIARFTTPDPYQASGGPADPQSWNRYAYVQSDPINYNDPLGLQQRPVERMIYPGEDYFPSSHGGGGGICGWVGVYTEHPYWACWLNPSGGSTQPPKRKCSEDVTVPTEATWAAATAVLLGEDSWVFIGQNEYRNGDSLDKPTGPEITDVTVIAEEYLMLNAILNLAQANSRTTLEQINTPGQYAGYDRGKKFLEAYQNLPFDSSECEHLRTAVATVTDFFTQATVFSHTIMYWRAVVQPGAREPRTQGPEDLRIARTDFF
jgi:RHS repeat-associated protein